MREQVFSRVLLFLIGLFSFPSAAFAQIKTIIRLIPGNKESVLFGAAVMKKDEKLSTRHSSLANFIF